MSRDWEFNHAGMVTGHKNELLRYYQSLGIGLNIGPQPLLPYVEGDTTISIWRTLEGEPMSATFPSSGMHTFFDGNTLIGSLQLECIPPAEGSFIWEYLQSKGEGINHLCFNVPDPERETARLGELGCGVMFSASTNGQLSENYVDTRGVGDVILSLRPPAGSFEKAWKAHHLEHPLVRDWEFLGVGIAVRDLEAAARFYDSLGFAELEPEVDVEVEGGKARARRARVGPITYEFVQPLERDPVWREALGARGEGIRTLNFGVEDLERETVLLEQAGAARLLGGTRATGEPVATFDTRQLGNTAVQLVQTR